MNDPVASPAGSASGLAPDAPLFVVLNSGSGRHDAQDTREVLGRLFEAAGRRHEFLMMQNGADLDSVTREAVRCACAQGGIVVAAGGDGTINAVAQRVVDAGCPFGVLPQGTFNYFGREHGIPQDTEAAARVLLNAHPMPVQVGRVNERVFLVNASLGLYRELLEDRERVKEQLGRRRWVAMLAGLLTLLREPRQLRLTLEVGGQTRSIGTPSLFVGNNRLQFERLGLPEAGALECGSLVAIFVRPIGTLALLGLALRGALGMLGDAENVKSFPVQKLTVLPRGRRWIKVAMDGEVHLMRTPLVFRVAPEALTLMVPSEPSRVEPA